MLLDLFLSLCNMWSRWMSWCRINFVRRILSKGKQPTIDDISVLHKSDDFIVVNKHEDVRVNSDDPAHTVTVETQLAKLFPEAVDETAGHSFRFVHRLDFATSGALCVATNKPSSRWGHKAFEKRYVTKHYLALVRGKVPVDVVKGHTMNKSIGRDDSVKDIHKMCVEDNPNCTNLRTASSTMYLLEHGTYRGKHVSKVILVPHTGRTHQLRVHCLDYGHKIVGDYTYSNRQDVIPPRMMLHAYRLVIPMKRETIDVTAPDPFLPGKDPLWAPMEVLNTYEKFVLENPIHYEKDNPEKKKWKRHGKNFRPSEDNNTEGVKQDLNVSNVMDCNR